MGYSVYQLEVIKRHFVASNPADLKKLFNFIESQLEVGDYHKSVESGIVNTRLIKKVKENLERVTPRELEDILEFTEQRIEVNRSYDKAEVILGEIKKEEFYSREERYTELEKYIFKLKLG